MNPTRFEVRSLSKTYGTTQALTDISFAVTTGEHLAILGRSGSGKSTILRLLAGLDTPDTGVVLLNDVAVSERDRILLPPHRRGISLVFQDLALWPNLSAEANVMLGLSGLKLGRREARSRTQEALSLCGIEDLAKRKPGAMSGGQQQRVALARAVAVRPAFLLMDEPYAGLDLVLKSRLLPEVRELARLREMTVILVTHDPLEALSLCRYAVVLECPSGQRRGCPSSHAVGRTDTPGRSPPPHGREGSQPMPPDACLTSTRFVYLRGGYDSRFLSFHDHFKVAHLQTPRSRKVRPSPCYSHTQQ